MDILCFVRPSPPWGRTTGAVRPEDYPHREGCVRDKWEAQKPATALASGFKPPHSLLERKKNVVQAER